MRRRFKDKKQSYALCKPHKRRRTKRWKTKDLEFMTRSEKEIEAMKAARMS